MDRFDEGGEQTVVFGGDAENPGLGQAAARFAGQGGGRGHAGVGQKDSGGGKQAGLDDAVHLDHAFQNDLGGAYGLGGLEERGQGFQAVGGQHPEQGAGAGAGGLQAVLDGQVQHAAKGSGGGQKSEQDGCVEFESQGCAAHGLPAAGPEPGSLAADRARRGGWQYEFLAFLKTNRKSCQRLSRRYCVTRLAA